MKNELGNMDNQGTKNKCFLSRDEILTNIYYLQPLTYNNKKVLTTSQLVGVFGVGREKLLYRFRKHKDDFKYGQDYYLLNQDEMNKMGYIYK